MMVGVGGRGQGIPLMNVKKSILFQVIYLQWYLEACYRLIHFFLYNQTLHRTIKKKKEKRSQIGTTFSEKSTSKFGSVVNISGWL